MRASRALALVVGALAVTGLVDRTFAAPIVPGTGEKVTKVSDDLEDPNWSWKPNNPKSSSNIDKSVRGPGGASSNGKWMEGAMRGQPDFLKRVPTPEDGIPGSTGALLMRTFQSGVPGSPSGENQQDDLLLNIRARMGGTIPASWSPNAVVRVYLAPWDKWEQRVGNSFGFRLSCETTATKKSGSGFFSRTETKMETYWPGMFIHYNGKNSKGEYSASLLLRGGPSGADFWGPKMTEPGWWTLGMSVSPDGAIHYYASPGADDLTEQDRISSQYPYGYRAERFDTFFFDLVNRDDGSTWSTPWIIDDPTLYIIRR